MRGSVHLTCGFPGSGKSSWAMERARASGYRVISADGDPHTSAPAASRMISAYAQLHSALSDGQHVIFDACSLRTSERSRIRGIARSHDALCHLVIFCTRWSICHTRDRQRGGVISIGRWKDMREMMATTMAGVEREGFESVTYLPYRVEVPSFVWCS